MSFSSAGAVFGGPGSWKAEIPPGWDIFGVTNGGFLMSIATRAMESEADGRELISATGTFLNPAHPGPVEVDVSTLKAGRSLSTLRARLSRNERPLVAVNAVFEDRDRPAPRQDMVNGHPPELPPPDDCVPMEPSHDGPLPPPFAGKVEIRSHPVDIAAMAGDQTGGALMRGWFRLRDGEPLDAHSVVVACDGLAPAIFNSPYPAGWTPTIELTVQVRHPRPRGWLACRFATRFVTNGMLEEDGEIWDEDGGLVALSRQLALVPR
ncbi:MAG TPA: thioesterase family protein [Acidimicrobiia bacterium]|nr:thioesterase family protein [Acidimicrobiia bacterium]